jgi:hypothetical protein
MVPKLCAAVKRLQHCGKAKTLLSIYPKLGAIETSFGPSARPSHSARARPSAAVRRISSPLAGDVGWILGYNQHDSK